MKREQVRKRLKIAITVLSLMLVLLIVIAVALAGEKDGDSQDPNVQSTQPSGTAGNMEEPALGTDLPEDPSSEQLLGNYPTDENPVLLDQGLYVVHMGNFTGRYVEDGSDAEIENVCAAVVENRGEKTVQLAEFEIVWGENVYEFRLTTLPPGERAIVQDLNKQPLGSTDQRMTTKVDVLAFFSQEPVLHEDVFSVTGSENCIELRNISDFDISGPIYVYYKTRTAEGYAGGITYRLSIPSLKAGESYQAFASHFWVGSSQVMFIDYAE